MPRVNMLKAGLCAADITPEKGVRLAGYPHALRVNTGVHDPLFASCLVLDNGHSAIALMSVDLLWLSKPDVALIRRLASDASGIPESHIMVCCTHTHSAHVPASFGPLSPAELAVTPSRTDMEQLCRRIAGTVPSAMENMFEAEVGVAAFRCGAERGIGGNRRDPKNGAVDPVLYTLGVRDTAGVLRGCVNRYALHPTALHEDNTLVSADYPGALRRILAQKWPGLVALFLQGTSGDQSNRHFKIAEGFDEAERMGRILAEAAEENLDAMRFERAPVIAALSEEVELPMRELPDPETARKAVESARAALEASKALDAASRRAAEVALFGAEEMLGFSERMRDPKERAKLYCELPAEVQVLRIGDTAIVGLQGELFVEYGLSISADSSFAFTVVAELANGGLPGYLCTAEAYEAGGYEAGASLLAPAASDILVNTAKKLLKTLYRTGDDKSNRNL